MMQGIGSAGAAGAKGFDGDWQRLYKTLKGSGKIIEADQRNNVQCSKKDGFVGIEFDIGGDEQVDVRIAPCSRQFVPANGMEGTKIHETEEQAGKRVYFFKVDAPYIPDGARADLRFEVIKNGEKTEERELSVMIRENTQ
jgi:hypothetical protein